MGGVESARADPLSLSQGLPVDLAKTYKNVYHMPASLRRKIKRRIRINAFHESLSKQSELELCKASFTPPGQWDAANNLALWVQDKPWEHFATFTWVTQPRDEIKAEELIMRWARRNLNAGGDWQMFYAAEKFKGKDEKHVHAIIHSEHPKNIYLRGSWFDWWSKYGRMRLETIEKIGGVSAYCAKYVSKDMCSWGILTR